MVWPALISSQHSEKPSIIRLMNALSDAVYYYMELIAIYHHVCTQIFCILRKLLSVYLGELRKPYPAFFS